MGVSDGGGKRPNKQKNSSTAKVEMEKMLEKKGSISFLLNLGGLWVDENFCFPQMKFLEFSGSLWKFWEVFGSLGKFLEVYGRFWKFMEGFGSVRKFLEV